MSEDLKYYTDETFFNSKDEHVFYGFFSRTGGMSKGVYKSLNCGLGSQDPAEYVMHNRIIVARAAGVNPRNLLSVYQEHGNQVKYVERFWSERPRADAMVTDKSGFGLGILTADCAPILFIGQKALNAPVIGAAHAGWKGALSGVLENTVASMVQLGAAKETIRACVGPCIGRRSYEVGADFPEAFIDHNPESERFFASATREGHFIFDLSGYCVWRLAIAGVKSIVALDKDTYSKEEEFYSYRRMTHKGEEDYGRQISVVSIRGAN